MTAVDYQEILTSTQDEVRTITLNRPDKLNAWTSRMEQEFEHAVKAAGEEDAIRAILITGAGRGFCAGADMSLLASAVQAPGVAAQDAPRKHSWMLEIPKPIVGAINGPAVGLGFVIALYCDVRLASDQARFCTIFAKRGLIAEYGMAWMLPRVVGLGHALDLLFSARMVDAQEAHRIGLINRVFPHAEFAAAAQAYAAELASAVSPRSLRLMKRQVYDSFAQTLHEAVDVATREMYGSFGTEDFREGVAHFLEKRGAAFTGR